MKSTRSAIAWLYWTIAAIAVVVAIFMAISYAPIDPTMGVVQKITYLHVPIAINTFLACVVVFLANIGYIWQRNLVWDDLASAGAQVAVLFCLVVLLTGMIWARQAWNQWWIWSPLLTFSLVLWMLYFTYLAIHRFMRGSPRREITCAVYGAIAFLDVPLVYLSVKLLPDKHPSKANFTPEMFTTLIVWFIPITMICGGLIASRYKLNRRTRLSRELERIDLKPGPLGRALS